MVRVSAQDISVDDHLDGLKERFDLMVEEIDSLRRERDEYREKVDSQANELKSIRRSNVCLLCRDELSVTHLASQSQIIKAQNILPGKFASQRSQPWYPSKQRLPKPSVDMSPRPSVVSSRIPLYRPVGTQSHSAAPGDGHTISKMTSTKLSTAEEPNINSPSQTIPLHPSIQSGTPTASHPPAYSLYMHQPTSPLSSSAIRPSLSTPLRTSLSSTTSTSSVITAECHHDESVDLNHNIKKQLRVDAVHKLPHAHGVYCIKFSIDGRCLAVASRAKVFIYDLKTGVLTCTLVDLFAEDTWIRAMSFSPNGKYLATGSEDCRIRIWETDKKFVRNVFKSHTKRVRCLAFSPNGQFLLSAALDNTVRIWNMRGGSVKIFTNPESRREFKTATFSPDGKYVAAGNGDGIVRIWDVRTGQLVQRLKGHTGIVYGVEFMPHGKGLVTGSKDSTLKYWNTASLEHIWSLHTKEPQARETKPVREFSGHNGSIYSIAVSYDGRWIVSGARDESVRIWDAHNMVPQFVIQGLESPIFSVEFSPVGRHLASGAEDGTVRIWRYVEN